MSNHLASRQRQATPASASATQTITNAPSQPAQPFPIAIPPSGTLRLRAASNPTQTTSTSEERHIQWAEDVVDNEGMGKKSSKVCCIYHKPHSVDESSEEEDSSDSSDSDESDRGAGSGDARPVRRSRARRRPHGHKHDHGKDDGERKPSPNAYERQPTYSKGKEKAVEQ